MSNGFFSIAQKQAASDPSRIALRNFNDVAIEDKKLSAR